MLPRRFIPTSAFAALLLASCSNTPYVPLERPAPRPLGRDLLALPPDAAAVPSPQPTTAAAAIPDEPTGVLTLRQALAQTLVKNHELASFSYDIRAAEARTLQAGLIPNPEIGGEVEDFGGTGARRGFSTAQSTLSLSQVIELGSKRMKRVRLARLDENLAAWEYEAKRLDVLTEATRAFVDVLVAQRKLALAEANLSLERQVFDTVVERVRAGRVSPLEQQRAQVSLSNGRVALERARRELRIARERLAAFWGSTRPIFERADGDLDVVAPAMPLPELLALAEQNPDLARWSTEIAQRKAKVDLERARNIPDPQISLGLRRYNDENDHALVAGVSIPLPIFGINIGNVREAEALVTKGYEQRRAAEVRVSAAISRAYQELTAAYDELLALRRDVLPAAETAFEGARIGYQQGKFSLIEVLDARRALADARGREIDALAAYHAALAEAERLTGQSLRQTADKGGRS